MRNPMIVGLVAMMAVPPISLAEEGGDPSQVVSNFMAQFLDVEPDLVMTTVLDTDGRQAIVKAETESGEACTFEVEKAPHEVEARYRWLVGSIDCN